MATLVDRAVQVSGEVEFKNVVHMECVSIDHRKRDLGKSSALFRITIGTDPPEMTRFMVGDDFFASLTLDLGQQ